MSEFVKLVVIGIALSLDAFSLALSMGTLNLKNNKNLIISMFVGIFHLFMPLMGIILGHQITKIFYISDDFLLAAILFYIAFEMMISIIKKEEIKWKMNIIGILSFSFGVSIDSFSVGFGLKAITDHIFIAIYIFSFCALLFTYLGLLLGKYAKKRLGTLANIIGIILLIALGIIHLL